MKSDSWTLVTALCLAASVASTPARAQVHAQGQSQGQAQQGSEPLLIVAPHCLRCGPARELAERLSAELPGTTLRQLAWSRADEAMAERLDPSSRAPNGGASFPVFVVEGAVLYGYLNDAHTGGRIRTALGGRPPGAGDTPSLSIRVPRLGHLHADEAPRALFTATVGSLDGVHPTAPWALLLLLPLVVGVAGVRRVALLGAVFVGGLGTVYGAFTAGWIAPVRLSASAPNTIVIATGLVAGVGGFLTLWRAKRLARPKRVSVLGVADPEHPPATSGEGRLWKLLEGGQLTYSIALSGALGAWMGLVEILSTTGLPALFAEAARAWGLSGVAFTGHLVLFLTVRFLPTVLLTVGALWFVVRLRQRPAGSVILHVGTGGVLLLLGLFLWFQPQMLFGALWVG